MKSFTKSVFKKALLQLAFAVVSLVFLSILFVNLAPQIIISLPANTWKLKRSDAIIVLGTPSRKDGKPSPTMRERVKTAVELFKNGYGKYLIVTGAAAHNDFIEADVMARQSIEEGVPVDRIIREPQAKNTYQNAYNSFEIMQQRGFSSAVIVSSPSHLLRSNLIFSNYPIDYCMYGCAYPKELSLWEQLLFDQKEKYFVTTDVLLNKGLGLGLTPEQALKMPQIAKAAKLLHQ